MPVLSPTLDRLLTKTNTGGYADYFPIDLFGAVLAASNILDVAISDAAPGDTAKLWLDPDNATPASAVYRVFDVPTATWVPLTPLRFMQWLVKRGGQNIPTGSIQAYGGIAAPSGWLLCNGAAVSRATYADLFAVIGISHGVGDGSTTFNLPDLRGEFLRGVDTMGTARGADPGRVLGTSQADAFEKHHHASYDMGSGQVWNDAGGIAIGPSASGRALSAAYTAVGARPSVTTADSGDTETRPRNVAVTYLIKV